MNCVTICVCGCAVTVRGWPGLGLRRCLYHAGLWRWNVRVLLSSHCPLRIARIFLCFPPRRSTDMSRAVRSRRWVRYAAHVATDTIDGARAHLLTMLKRIKKLETQMGAFVEFNAKLADELQTRQTLVTEYEAKITSLQTAMALSAATGPCSSLELLWWLQGACVRLTLCVR